MKKKFANFLYFMIFLCGFSHLPAYGVEENPLQTCADCKIKILKESSFEKATPNYKESLVIIKKSGKQDWKVNPLENPAIIKARELAKQRKAKKAAQLAEKKRLAKLKAEEAEKRRLASIEEAKRKKELARKKRLAKEKRKKLLAKKRALAKRKKAKSRRAKIRRWGKGWLLSAGYAPLGTLQGSNLTAGYFWGKYSVEGSLLYNTEIIDPYNKHWNGISLTGKYYLKHQGAADYFNQINYYGKVNIGVSSSDASDSFGAEEFFFGVGGGVSYPIYHRIRVFGEVDAYMQDGEYHGESFTLGLKIRF